MHLVCDAGISGGVVAYGLYLLQSGRGGGSAGITGKQWAWRVISCVGCGTLVLATGWCVDRLRLLEV